MELEQLRSYVEPKFHPHVDELLQLVNEQNERTSIVIPPLESDLPLSHRTGDAVSSSRVVGTTATPIEGFVHHSSSLDLQTG